MPSISVYLHQQTVIISPEIAWGFGDSCLTPPFRGACPHALTVESGLVV